MTYKLFLDDERNPMDVRWGSVENQISYAADSWVIVRTRQEFFQTLHDLGMPELISFDHDLGTDEKGETTTAMSIMKQLCNMIIESKVKRGLPKVWVHSQNPVGADNLRVYWLNFLRVWVK